MSFYGGRPGKSFIIHKVFRHYGEMFEDAQNSKNNEFLDVPENAFVLINYGTPGSEEFNTNKENEELWFEQTQNSRPAVSLGDYNATLWWDFNQPGNYNSTVWLKKYIIEDETEEYRYDYIANIGAIFPQISNTTGNWVIPVGSYSGEYDTGVPARAKEIEFRILQDVDTSKYSLLSKEVDGTIKYGLSDLDERYNYNENIGEYERNENGQYIQVFLSDVSGDFYFNADGNKQYFDDENPYLLQTDFQGIFIGEEISYLNADFLQWKYINEDDTKWRNILDVSQLQDLATYANIASRAAALAENAKEEVSKLSNAVKLSSEKIEEAKEIVEKKSTTVDANVKEIQLLLNEINNKIEDGIVLDTEEELVNARANFKTLSSRLNHIPYEFDLFYDMLGCEYLSPGDRCLVFGLDAVGDTDSKLYGIFAPDDPRLEEVIEGSQTEDNVEGEKVIAEQEKLLNSDLIAGLLTVFSGKGSGGGGGTTLIPTIKIDSNSHIVQSGKTVTLNYTISNPVGGNITLYVTDSLGESVIDENSKKNYSKGEIIRGNASPNGSIVWKPKRNGIHKLTFYFMVARDGSFSNEEYSQITVGGIVLTPPADGQLFQENKAINLTYRYTSIFTDMEDAIILKYDLYQGNNLIKSDYIESPASSTGDFKIAIKKDKEDIGSGAFKLVATAYLKSDESITSAITTTNFTISKYNIITLISTYNSESIVYAEQAYLYPLIINFAGTYSTLYINAFISKYSDFSEEIALGEQEFSGSGASNKFNYSLRLPEVGLWYVRFEARGLNISATSDPDDPLIVEIDAQKKIEDFPMVTGDLVLDFNANLGQTNAANKNIWENHVQPDSDSNDNPINCTLINYNYASNGWDSEIVNGASYPTGYLYSAGNVYGLIDYDIFSEYKNTQGLTLECVFKTEKDLGRDLPILAYHYASTDETQGIFIYQNRALINMPFLGYAKVEYEATGMTKEDNAIHVTFVLDKQITEDTDRLIKIYVNGVLSAVTKLNNANVELNSMQLYVNGQLKNGQVDTGISKIGAIRLYQRPLNDNEVLINYIHNLRDIDRTQQEVADKNSLQKTDGGLVPIDAENVPRMNFYLTTENWNSMTKDKKAKNVKITFKDPNLGENKEWNGCDVSWQGTSSIEYPVKNFKFKLKNEKYVLKTKDAEGNIIEKTQPEKTFCLKADYMDSSHFHNTGNANFINDTGFLSYSSLTPPQADELGVSVADGYLGLNGLSGKISEDKLDPLKLKTRTTIYGYPIVLYVYLTDSENPNEPSFEGIYNFNLDKGSTDSFGLYREKDNKVRFQDCTSFEIKANRPFTTGGFRKLKFIKRKKNEENKYNYGWTHPTVYYTENYGTELKENYGKYWKVIATDDLGQLKNKEISELLIEDEIEYTPITYIDKTSNITYSGVFDNTKRYNSLQQLDNQGSFIQLLKIDEETYQLLKEEKVTDSGNIIVSNVSNGFVDLEKANIEIKYSITTAAASYELFNEWEIIDLPENLSYYYQQYSNCFELRFPDMDEYVFENGDYKKTYYKELDKIIALIEWVDSYAIYDYLDGNQIIERVPDKFLNEFSQHFDKNTALRYYIYTITTGLIDNFGKNLMIDTWGYDANGNIPYVEETIENITYRKVWKYIEDKDQNGNVIDYFKYGLMDPSNGNILVLNNENEYEIDCIVNTSELFDLARYGWNYEIDYNRIIWYPHFYDLDSCLGSDNKGLRLYPTSIEMRDTNYIQVGLDTIKEAPPFNTAESSLWSKIAVGFKSEIKTLWENSAENNGIRDILTWNNFDKYYNQNIIKVLGERWYNLDAYPKYISKKNRKVIKDGNEQVVQPSNYIYLAFGHDLFRTKRWLTDRLYYINSELQRENDKPGDGFYTRTSSSEKGTYRIEIETYKPCYFKVLAGQGNNKYQRILNYNEKHEFLFDAVNNQEVIFSPGDNIKYFKITQAKFEDMTISGAPNLLELDCSSIGDNIVNIIGIGAAKKLRSINLTNCNHLQANSASVNEINFPYLETFKNFNSNSYFSFNNGDPDLGIEAGGILKTVYLNDKSVTDLTIEKHYDLTDLSIELKYNSANSNGNFILDEQEISSGNIAYNTLLQSRHNLRINNVNISNCPYLRNINVVPYYLNKDGKYLQSNQLKTNLNNFISQFGFFSLFQNILNLSLNNTFSNPDNPNPELLISLSQLKKLSVTNCAINKITFIATDSRENQQQFKHFHWLLPRSTDGQYDMAYSAYPGTGGTVKQSDIDYLEPAKVEYKEGLLCDKNIKTIEFRAKDSNEQTIAKSAFELPWRICLGTLEGLEQILINVGKLNKKISSDAVTNATGRFELILPDGKNSNLKKIQITNQISEINFTCIKQPSYDTDILELSDTFEKLNGNKYYFNTIYKNDRNLIETINYNGTDHYRFCGIDFNGHPGIIVNSFKGFKKIKSILGMNNIGIAEILNVHNNKSLSQYFYNCENLSSFYQTDGLTDTDKWDFTQKPDWLKATNLNEMFYNCKKLTTEFIKGFLNIKDDAFENLVSAKQMFQGCKSLNRVKLNWGECPMLEDITGLFQDCSPLSSTIPSLQKAEIKIFSPSALTSLKAVFSGCSALTEAKINLYRANDNSEYTTAIDNISNFDELFLNCSSLESFDMQHQGIFDESNNSTNENKWDLKNLKTAKKMFYGCKNLTTVIFPQNINLINATILDQMFCNCENLTDIFNQDDSEIYLFNDTIGTTQLLSLEGMFENCKKLKDIGIFGTRNIDLQRVSSITNLFKGCSALNELDLSHWDFSQAKTIFNFDSIFYGCEKLKDLALPRIKVKTLSSSFQNCKELERLDITNLELIKLTKADNLFNGCEKLITLSGYENWDMSQVKTVSKMFANCGLKELDFSNWKFYNKEINCSGFFQFSDKLNKIKGLDTLFGTIEDMQNGTYGTVSAGGAISMFEGTSLFNSENLLDDDGLTSTVRYWGLPFKDVSSLENFFAATKISKIGLVTRDDNYLNYSFGHNNLQNVRSFLKTFLNCTSLKRLNITPHMLLLDSPEEYWFYNLKNVYISNISSFVSGCSNLELFKLSTGSLENLATIESIFYSCSALKSIILPTNKSLKLSLDISNTKIAADEPGTDTNEGFQNIQIWLDENEGGFIKTLFPFKESEANIPTEGVIYVPRTFSDEEVNFLGGLVSEKNWLVAKKEN